MDTNEFYKKIICLRSYFHFNGYLEYAITLDYALKIGGTPGESLIYIKFILLNLLYLDLPSSTKNLIQEILLMLNYKNKNLLENKMSSENFDHVPNRIIKMYDNGVNLILKLSATEITGFAFPIFNNLFSTTTPQIYDIFPVPPNGKKLFYYCNKKVKKIYSTDMFFYLVELAKSNHEPGVIVFELSENKLNQYYLPTYIALSYGKLNSNSSFSVMFSISGAWAFIYSDQGLGQLIIKNQKDYVTLSQNITKFNQYIDIYLDDLKLEFLYNNDEFQKIFPSVKKILVNYIGIEKAEKMLSSKKIPFT